MHNAQRIRLTLAALTMVVFVAAASADYEVQPGDNLNRIAADLGITTADLAAANDLADPNLIRVGQILIVPGQAPGGAITHVVSPGETLAGIARKYGTSVGGLVSTNGLANPNLITIGQQLLVPTAASASASGTSAPVPTGASHTVQAGETLAAIAARYGTTVEVIAAANGITDTSTIYIGTVLQLTGSGFVAEAPQAVSVVHRVAAGENLSGLAAQFGTTVDALASTNGIADPNLIRVGQEIQVPSNTPSWSCPIPGARFFNDWGFPRSGGRFHEGNDLFAPRGTPVVAPVTGTA
ncbi:MAG: LysM peptidoglycan-binding domain-containing protein, partial [Acidimicrobiia bacterium]